MERRWSTVQCHNRVLHDLLCMLLYHLNAIKEMLTNVAQYSSRNSIWKLNSTRVPALVKIVVQSGSLLGEEHVYIACYYKF